MASSDGARSRIPWTAPAVLGRKCRNAPDYVPELVGLTLNQALAHATDPALSAGGKLCIWVDWGGRQVVLRQNRIGRLATRPDRPMLPE